MTAATPTITAPAAPRPSGLGLRWPRQRLLTAAIVLGTVPAWEAALLALLARPMLAFLLVLATLRGDG